MSSGLELQLSGRIVEPASVKCGCIRVRYRAAGRAGRRLVPSLAGSRSPVRRSETGTGCSALRHEVGQGVGVGTRSTAGPAHSLTLAGRRLGREVQAIILTMIKIAAVGDRLDKNH
eukprot:576194-Hanusia_phi.AAC.1